MTSRPATIRRARSGSTPGAHLERVPDARGVEVRTVDARAAAELSAAIDGLATHRADTLVHLARALELDPGLVVAHVLRGWAAALLGRRDLAPVVRAAHREAARGVVERDTTDRERLLVDGLGAWCDGEPARALAALEATLEAEPLDLLALKLHHAACFYLGESARMRAAVERALPHWRRAEAPRLGAVLGCHAFALTETEETARAVEVACEAAREGLARGELDPWGKHAHVHALHALAHVDEALDRIATMGADLEGANNFAGHVHWHEAMLRIERGELARALALHDREIAIYPARDYRDTVNTTTLLFRLARHGVDVRDRWQLAADAAEASIGDHGSSFADVHYVLALLGAGRHEALRRFLASMVEVAHAEHGHAAELARALGVDVARAIASLDDAPAHTAARLRNLADGLQPLGGSLAQRRIFRWIREEAERRLAERGERA